jgi:hypothetical protein
VPTELTNISFKQIGVQQALVRKPPHERTDRGQRQLDPDPGRRDRDPFPALGQHPTVGNIDEQTGRKYQQHDAQLVAFAAEMLAGQRVGQFVQHLGQGDRDGEPDQVLRAEERRKLRQTRLKLVETQPDPARGHQDQQQRSSQQPGREQPA